MTAIHDATPTQVRDHEDRKARLERMKAHAKPAIPQVQSKPAKPSIPIIIKDVGADEISKLQAEVDTLRKQINEPPSFSQTTSSVAAIQKLVCETYKTSLMEMNGQRRNVKITLPRQIAVHLCIKWTALSFPQIGRKFGGRDHTTIISANNKVVGKRANEPAFDAEVVALENALGVTTPIKRISHAEIRARKAERVAVQSCGPQRPRPVCMA